MRKSNDAAITVNIAVAWAVLLSASRPFLEIRTAKAITKLKSIRLPPVTSPRESSGILFIAEIMPTNRLGAEDANDITKKATTNSLSPRNRATKIREFISHLAAKVSNKHDPAKTPI